MDPKRNDMIRETDILGLEKPTNQLKPLKRKSKGRFLAVMVIILVVIATLVYYF